MNKTTVTVLITAVSVLAVGGLTFFLIQKRREKKLSETYQKSVNDMVSQYGAKNIFN
jgi:peptidase E